MQFDLYKADFLELKTYSIILIKIGNRLILGGFDGRSARSEKMKISVNTILEIDTENKYINYNTNTQEFSFEDSEFASLNKNNLAELGAIISEIKLSEMEAVAFSNYLNEIVIENSSNFSVVRDYLLTKLSKPVEVD